MRLSSATELPEQLSESQRSALISLLADDDPVVYQVVRQRIISSGPEAAEWVKPFLLSEDPVLRRRTREIAQLFERQLADNRFLEFCLKQGEDCDLEAGAWLLARTQFPDINVAGYQALLDTFANDLRERVDFSSGAEELLGNVNEYLFSELKFHGNTENYYDPDNSYLNRVLDRRIGNPINLCLIYLLLSRRLRLPITGIGLPGHFICRYQSTSEEVYIDPFNAGKLLTKAACIQYLLQGNFSVRDDYLAPVTPRRMLLRICSNLHQIYARQEAPEEITRLQRYLVALSRQSST
jgi:regulator of sirC expression with transglutaminase-like and TPR domain